MVKETKFYDILGVSIILNVIFLECLYGDSHGPIGWPQCDRCRTEDSLQKGCPKTPSRYIRMFAEVEDTRLTILCRQERPQPRRRRKVQRLVQSL